VLTKQEKWNPLKERLWHTPVEVIWWILIGFIATLLLYYYFIII
jgi:acid phosphatase family membrane protein YuiD